MQMTRILFVLTSVEKALEIVDSFGTVAGRKLNRKKQSDLKGVSF